MAKIFGSFKTGVRAAFDPPGRALVRMGVSPDAITIAGGLGVVAASIVFAARGQLVTATIVITLFALLDVLDGSMARARGRSTRYGAVLDSTMDRVADGALFACLSWYLLRSGHTIIAAVCLFCLVGGQVVSYVKARAEGLGFTCDVGIAERMERLILVGIGGLLSPLSVTWAMGTVLWLLAGLTLITIVQRLDHVRRQEASAPSPATAPR